MPTHVLQLAATHGAIPARTPEHGAAMVAACILMAHADGEVAPAERRRMAALLRDEPGLAAMPRAALATEIAMHEANFRLDPEVAEQIALEALGALAGEPGASRRVVAACCELIPADGVAHPSEWRMLSQIKAVLGWTEPAEPAPRASLGPRWTDQPS